MPLNFDKIKEYGSLELLAKQMVEGFITGLHRSPYHGFSVEFAEHRLYNTGESTRHIDWKVFAKTDRLYVKRYEEETNLRCQIVLDNSSSMYYPTDHSKIRFGILAAACLTYMLQKQRDAVGISVFSEQIEWQSPVKSTPSHLNYLLFELEKLLGNVPVQKKTATAEILHQIADKIHKRSLVIIFSDMFNNLSGQDTLFAALKHLKHRLHEVLLFHVHDQATEMDFNFSDRPHEFIDLESNEKIRLMPSQIRSFYRQQTHDFYQNLKLKCGQFGIDWIEADIGKNIDQILLPYLIKRSKMK